MMLMLGERVRSAVVVVVKVTGTVPLVLSSFVNLLPYSSLLIMLPP